jgi:hypothetical protein
VTYYFQYKNALGELLYQWDWSWTVHYNGTNVTSTSSSAYQAALNYGWGYCGTTWNWNLGAWNSPSFEQQVTSCFDWDQLPPGDTMDLASQAEFWGGGKWWFWSSGYGTWTGHF